MLCAKYNLQSERTFETPCRPRTYRTDSGLLLAVMINSTALPPTPLLPPTPARALLLRLIK